MSKTVCIIDYNLGNLFSVNQALINTGLNVITSSNSDEILKADALVLPGVGAFGDAMDHLKHLNIIGPLLQSVVANKPLFGICLGLQLLFTESEEFGLVKGLDLIKGRVTRFNNTNASGETRKVPQIGWNTIYVDDMDRWIDSPLKNIPNNAHMYFVHSFYIDPFEDVALSITNYDGQKYVSSILKENIFACQFHPEKSGEIGLKIYHDWAIINNLK